MGRLPGARPPAQESRVAVRAIRATDVVSLVTFEGRALPNEARVRTGLGRSTERPLPVAAILEQWIPFEDRRNTWVAVEGFSIHGLIAARLRAGRSVWEVDWLVVDTAIDPDAVTLELLDRLTQEGGEAGAERVFLRLPTQSALMDVVRRSGFWPFVTETLYRWEPGPRPTVYEGSPLVAALRPKTKADDYAVFRLYNQVAPEGVRRAAGVTYREWRETDEPGLGRRREWVAEREGRVIAWVRTARSRSGGVFDVMAHPEAEGEMESLAQFALSRLDSRTPAFCLA
ncbi:MAG: hypothetical protein NTZ05_14895, partial [Chloroflexi bacterium]|nr:hypothetical protein [Chloroflexota bacterium]